MMAGCVLIAALVIGRAVQIQIIGNDRLDNMTQRQFSSHVLIRPRRGIITDRNGEPLAVNVERQSLAADPSRIQNRKTLARLLSKATNISYSRLLSRLKGKREFVWIKRHLSEAELGRLKSFGIIDSAGDLSPGLWMVNESQRVYPHGELAAHVLGSVNLDSEGLEGVELWADDKLQGKVVSVQAVKDALGRPAFLDAVAAKDVKDGEPVNLTIDASLQFAVEQELKASVSKTGSRSGTAIVMNAVTGEILALANEPSFNPNQKGSRPEVRRNRAVTDGYEPGSTMKPVLLATALSHGFRLTDRIYGEKGSFVVQGHRISEAETHERFEWLTLKRIIQVSSNVGAAKLALKLGADRFLEGLRMFGFGARTGLGFPGEISGVVPPRKNWKPLRTANIGFGQGVLVTPMQMVRAYAAFLNGGWLVQPTLLKGDFDGFKPEPPKRILSQNVADQVVEALASVTQEGGTGEKAVLPGYEVAGKTGTAQEVDPATGRYSRSRYVASFIGSAIRVQPKLVIFASLDDPKTSYYAAETAAPLFREILNAAVTRFSIPGKPELAPHPVAEIRDELRLSLAKVVAPSPDAARLTLWKGGTSPDGSVQYRMPDLGGMTAREALRTLTGHPFRVELHGSGVVKSQSPDEGKPISENAIVHLHLSEP
jgi:cell division protein FtsI (penicillin-binding protein 3)